MRIWLEPDLKWSSFRLCAPNDFVLAIPLATKVAYGVISWMNVDHRGFGMNPVHHKDRALFHRFTLWTSQVEFEIYGLANRQAVNSRDLKSQAANRQIVNGLDCESLNCEWTTKLWITEGKSRNCEWPTCKKQLGSCWKVKIKKCVRSGHSGVLWSVAPCSGLLKFTWFEVYLLSAADCNHLFISIHLWFRSLFQRCSDLINDRSFRTCVQSTGGRYDLDLSRSLLRSGRSCGPVSLILDH